MVFSSPIFLFYFLPVVLIFFFLGMKRIRWQNALLFFSSLLFYFWGEKSFTILVLISVLINYSTAYLLERSQDHRKLILSVGIILNLGLLLYFKYVNFFVLQVLPLFETTLPNYQSIHLPLGISFYTFHGITYIVDVYRREAKPCDSLLNTGLYILFFPQLIAGPIVKFVEIEKQLYQRVISNEKLHLGIKRFIIGLAKKIILANALGRLADDIFALPLADLSAPVIWLGAFVYAYQVYFDFSGYSDMAIGLAKMMGFDFKENFNFPFAASTFSDLWQRWHMSLTDFFKNYVYIPLGGNRKGRLRTSLNILLVFALIGFWHGASWNCMLWGLFVGVAISLEKLLFEKYLRKAHFLVGNAFAMFLFVFAILIFRFEDLNQMGNTIAKAFGFYSEYTHIYPISFFLTREYSVIIFVSILFAFPIHRWQFIQKIQTKFTVMKWLNDVALLLLFIITVSVMAASTYNPFIYFKF